MELQVVRHRTASDYFRDFFPSDTAAAYSYQLQRMFESGAAKEGDYFLVTDSGKAYLQVEIYRNNTRRIWEKTPVISPKAVPDKKKNGEALSLIYNFLKNDEYYFSPTDKLEIVISGGTDFSEELKALSNEFEYEIMGEYQEFSLSVKERSVIKIPEGVDFVPFTELSPEERFGIVLEHDELCKYFDNIKPASFYQDYLDEGYFSEELWQVMSTNSEFAGFSMPAFTSGFKNKIKLLNYYIIEKENKKVSDALLFKTIETAIGNKIGKIEFSVRSSDINFIESLKREGADKIGSVIRYIKK